MNFKLCCVHGNCDRTYNVVVQSQTELDNKNFLTMYMYILISVSIISMLLSIHLLCYYQGELVQDNQSLLAL